ncbi:MAG: hypothetical protein KNU04_gp78 [crAssphage sp. isolate ctbg_1]|uniref:Uncharacterized protein n=1 Tax=crAssphage sp. isolate ctbg_1 TaxID=2989854 RepID=A0A345MT11_9CAUD|nr:MAG: hypothetical protein KNU04_gp78 [crAssphage sp. isolate ctbg_1]AXH74511.1 MAG: hypothetical protein [crAssphage sp. isolate ctbg_1]
MENNIKIVYRVNYIVITVNNKTCELNKRFIGNLVLQYLKKKEYFLALDAYKSQILEQLDNEFNCLEYYYKQLKEVYEVYLELQLIKELEF